MSVQREKALKVFAGTTGRKELDKEMARIRKEFAKARSEYETSYAQLDALQNKVNNAQQRMDAARKALMDMSSQIQMMDLTGANAVRDRGDVKTYLVDGKEYHAEKSEDGNDVNMVLWKEFKIKKNEPEEKSEENDETDECYADDSVVQAYQDVLSLIS